MARRNGTLRVVFTAAGLVALGIGLAAVARATPQGQGKGTGKLEPDQRNPVVPITTVDGVELVGKYYRSPNSKEGPCAILLHKYGSDRSKGDWDLLARALQEKGYAVLTFDFRGHGESKTVNPNFWKYAVNKDLVTAGRDKTKIDVKDFKQGYFPWLVNDIAAARKFLEIKNDSGELNISSLFLIGAQEGASLGALFTATEWNRTYNVGFKALLTVGTKHIAGEDIAGCVWLSLTQRPVNTNFEFHNWLKSPQIRERTPMYIVYGEKDATAKQTAENVFRVLTTGREKNKFTQKYDVKGTDLAGQALLGQPALGVNAKIVEFVDKVVADRKAIPWGSVSNDENPLQPISLRSYGFSSKLP
jgi:hypothetical protein